MVKISSTYVGVAGGKLGQGVYYTRKGRTIARQYIEHPKDPKTPKQMNKRQRFALCEGFCQQMQFGFKKYWMTELDHQTKFNSLMSYTLNHAAVLVGDVWEMDWSRVRFSSGNLWGIINTGLTNPSEQTIEMTWEDDSGMGYAMDDDEFTCMFINLSTYVDKQPEGKSVQIWKTNSKRSDACCSYELDKDWGGCEVAVYGCFKSADGKMVTNTHYFGRISLEIQDPNFKSQAPNPKEEEPNTKTQAPNPKEEEPNFKSQAPNSNVQEPSSKVQNEDVKPPGEDEYEYYTT